MLHFHWFGDGLLVQDGSIYERWMGKTSGKEICLTCGSKELNGTRKTIESELRVQHEGVIAVTGGMRFL